MPTDFVTLFRGRADAYGSWTGGSVKQPLTAAHFARHLEGAEHIGVYPSFNVNGVASCVWGCTDIDYSGQKGWDDVWLLQRALAEVGIPAWVEQTVKGFHLWVFATALVSSLSMRNMQLAAHQVCELNPKEVNPKQTTLRTGEVGNYVRLPYPGGLQERRMIDNTGVYYDLEDFVSAAISLRVAPETIESIAELYNPPEPTRIYTDYATGDLSAALAVLSKLGRVIFRDGPLEGRDRSITMTHLAHECAKSGVNPNDALLILEDADSRWGHAKYLSRKDQGQTIFTDLLVRAYGHSDTESTAST